MQPEELDAIRARAEAATPGPWQQTADTPWGSKVILSESGEFYLGVNAHTAQPTDGWSPEARAQAVERGKNKCADATFIAHAREDIPRLLDEVAALQAALDEWAPVHDAFRKDHDVRVALIERLRSLLLAVVRSPTNHTGSRSFHEPPFVRPYTAKRLDNTLLDEIRALLDGDEKEQG